MYKYFDNLLREIEYRTTLVNFARYPLIMFAMAKILEITKEEIKLHYIYLMF